MNNLTKLSFSLGDDENLKFNGMTPYQYTDREVKIKSLTANGNPLTPDKNKNVDIPIKAQTASYIICAEDSVNKEGATVIVKRESPFAATDADGNLLYDENGNQILTNNLQIAFDEIFNRGDFKYGSEIVVRRGTYINESLKSYYHLYINKPCTVRFEDTHFYQLGVIHLEAYSNNYRGAGWIHLIGAYCNEIDISSAQNIVESCYANSIIVSSRLNTVINNLTSNIYLTGIDEEIYAKQCRFWGNTSIVRSTKSTYTQADGFVDTEGDIYQVNDIEGTEYIKSLAPIKSISANGTPLEPDENKNVDIPDAKAGQSGLLSATLYDFLRQLRNVSTYGEAFSIKPISVVPVIDAYGTWGALIENNTVYVLDSTVDCHYIDLTFGNFRINENTNGQTSGKNAIYMANAEIVFETKEAPLTFAYDSGLMFVGVDVEDGVFVPQPNMKYDIVISWYHRNNNANILIGYVSGYELPTNEVS